MKAIFGRRQSLGHRFRWKVAMAFSHGYAPFQRIYYGKGMPDGKEDVRIHPREES